MNRKTLIKDIETMEQVMGRTADRCDLWQDRCVYAIAVVVWHILDHIRRFEENRKDGTWTKNDDYTCNICGYSMIVGDGAYNFCPKCGAKMVNSND